jgi:hypothetical protein
VKEVKEGTDIRWTLISTFGGKKGWKEGTEGTEERKKVK